MRRKIFFIAGGKHNALYMHIQVAELNTLSDGKGITGIHSAVFLMRCYNYKVETFFFNIF